jgi:DNA-binding NarL/FixJ family response regulator
MRRLMVIADDSSAVQGIRPVLRQTVGFEVVGFVDGRTEVAHKLRELQPEFVLVDDMRDRDDTIARLAEIAEVRPEATAVLLASHPDEDWLTQALRGGAGVVLSKEIHPVALGTLLREIGRSTVVFRAPRAACREPDARLTARETEIVELAARGLKNSRIAAQLWVTEQTVKFHLSNAYRKLGVSNRTEASRFVYAGERAQVAAPAA